MKHLLLPFLFLLPLLFLVQNTTAQNLEWAKSMDGLYGYEQGQSIVVDDTGNVYTTGVFSGTVDFDPGLGAFNLTSAGGSDIFVSKLDSSGNFAWARRMGGQDLS